jgi:hypothetical protein
MNRAQLLHAVADVVTVLDEYLDEETRALEEDRKERDRSVDLDELREILGADEDDGLLDAARGVCASAQAAYDDRNLYKRHSSIIAALVGTNEGGDAVEAVRDLVKNKRTDDNRAERIVELERQIAALRASPPPPVFDGAVRDGDVVQIIKPDWEAIRKALRVLDDNETTLAAAERVKGIFASAGVMLEQESTEGLLDAVARVVDAAKIIHPEEWEAIRKALCARGDSETTLAAAERNRDRIIELAREIDEYDRQVAKAMRPIEVAPGKAVEGIHKLWMEVNALKSLLTTATEKLEQLKVGDVPA